MKEDAGKRIELLDPIVVRLNEYRARRAPHMSRPAIVTEALMEYLDSRERLGDEREQAMETAASVNALRAQP